ncbi:hypothetical protein [Candidatus Poriferisocius sp.]|uniref:hypothetical protein n=1 Tax=Candidatus Poriferisocius sp. TaxID=3101276 RepID=UPI003B5B9685
MNAAIAIPAVIILGCALIAGFIAFSTRKKRALWDIFPGPVPEEGDRHLRNRPQLFDGGEDYADGPGETGDHQADEARPKLELVGGPPRDRPAEADHPRLHHESLAEWHRRYEQTVSAWIENHHKVLGDINAAGLQIDLANRDDLLAGHEELAPKMQEAIAGHPSPVMRAELSAMHVAGEAAVFAVLKSDYNTARRQHLVYVQYRDEWIERLRQFSESPMSNLRAVMTTTEFDLEEIRAALETALIENEETEDAQDDFDTPLLVKEESTAIPDGAEPPDDTLDRAVGAPEDFTADLDGGRLRRLLRLPKRLLGESAGSPQD